MSLTSLPPTAADLLQLQLGIEMFQNATEATSEAAAINAGTDTVYGYAVKLLGLNISLSQVAMAVDALMFGATDNVTELTKLTTQFLPAQAASAVAVGLNPTVYAAEALGLALAGGNGTSNAFATNFGALSVSAFAQEVASATGVNANAIQGFANNWISFYTANPAATFGLSVTLASYGAAFGDAVGVALLNSTSANLQTVVPNALIDLAEGKYAVGTPLAFEPAHDLLQGEPAGPSGTLFLNGAAGTIDMSTLPSIDTIIYQTPATSSVTMNNQTDALTVNVEDNTTRVQTLTIGAKGPAPGISDSLTVIEGNAALNKGDEIGLITANGDELFTFRADGGAGVVDANFGVLLTPTAGGNEQVTFSGNTTLEMGIISEGGQAAIADLLPTGSLNVNNMTIKVTNTAATEFFDGQNLLFRTDTSGNAPFIGYSNNAVTIDASTSGGLIMVGGDANFISATTAAGSQGDTIVGAVRPVGLSIGGVTVGDILGGSVGNDTITSKSLTLPDYVFTDGGADTITLAAGHTGADHVAFYASSGNVGVSGGALAMSAVATSISEAPNFEFINPGWWGIAAGGASAFISSVFGFAGGTGTSTDQTMLTGFVVNQDFLDFSVKAWGAGDGVVGLCADDGSVIDNAGTAFVGLSSSAGTAVNAAQVSNGGSMKGTAGAPADFFILTSGTFLNANAVASALQSGTYVINHSLEKTEMYYDALIAYQGLDGNAHIADLNWLAPDSTTLKDDLRVTVSDIVTLVGVNIPQLAADISHIHLVT